MTANELGPSFVSVTAVKVIFSPDAHDTESR